MSKRARRNHTPAFKAKVALAAIKDDRTLAQIWSAPDEGTAGCIGLPEARVRALQEFAQAGAVIAILPESALDRFGSCLFRSALESMEPPAKRPAAPPITVQAAPGGPDRKAPRKPFDK